jgi:hypothetical protein
MSLATAAAIRNQVYSLLEALTPTTDATKFRRYRNEGGADFEAWAETHTTACFRRFQAREVGDDGEPAVSDTTQETVVMELEIRIAYPQTERYGSAGAMSRDDVRKEDWKKIKHTIGCEGRGNFTGSYDCTPLGAVETREEGGGVDFSVIRARFEYTRATT